MKLRNIIYTLFFIIFLISCVAPLYSTDIRGIVSGIRTEVSKPYPLAQTRVDLYQNINNSWKLLQQYFTDSDGMYYFFSVLPGEYYLQINQKLNYKIIVIDQKIQDLLPIVLEF